MYELLKIGKLPQSLGEVDPQEYPSRQRTKERLKGSLRKLLIKKKKSSKENACLAVINQSRRVQMTRHLKPLSVKAFIDVEMKSTFCP